MPSIAEQIAAATLTALSGAIPAVGTRVFRARVDAVPNSECPAIVVSSAARMWSSQRSRAASSMT